MKTKIENKYFQIFLTATFKFLQYWTSMETNIKIEILISNVEKCGMKKQ